MSTPTLQFLITLRSMKYEMELSATTFEKPLNFILLFYFQLNKELVNY